MIKRQLGMGTPRTFGLHPDSVRLYKPKRQFPDYRTRGISMHAITRSGSPGLATYTWISVIGLLAVASARAQGEDVVKKLEGFDAYMEKVLKDWNAPGVGVGI